MSVAAHQLSQVYVKGKTVLPHRDNDFERCHHTCHHHHCCLHRYLLLQAQEEVSIIDKYLSVCVCVCVTCMCACMYVYVNECASVCFSVCLYICVCVC